MEFPETISLSAKPASSDAGFAASAKKTMVFFAIFQSAAAHSVSAEADTSHVCAPGSMFGHVHAAAEHGSYFFAATGGKLCEAFITCCSLRAFSDENTCELEAKNPAAVLQTAAGFKFMDGGIRPALLRREFPRRELRQGAFPRGRHPFSPPGQRRPEGR